MSSPRSIWHERVRYGMDSLASPSGLLYRALASSHLGLEVTRRAKGRVPFFRLGLARAEPPGSLQPAPGVRSERGGGLVLQVDAGELQASFPLDEPTPLPGWPTRGVVSFRAPRCPHPSVPPGAHMISSAARNDHSAGVPSGQAPAGWRVRRPPPTLAHKVKFQVCSRACLLCPSGVQSQAGPATTCRKGWGSGRSRSGALYPPLPRVGTARTTPASPPQPLHERRQQGAWLSLRWCSYLVDPASSICLSQRLSHARVSTHGRYSETANGSLNQLWFL